MAWPLPFACSTHAWMWIQVDAQCFTASDGVTEHSELNDAYIYTDCCVLAGYIWYCLALFFWCMHLSFKFGHQRRTRLPLCVHCFFFVGCSSGPEIRKQYLQSPSDQWTLDRAGFEMLKTKCDRSISSVCMRHALPGAEQSEASRQRHAVTLVPMKAGRKCKASSSLEGK
jgi:hypothetical protein